MRRIKRLIPVLIIICMTATLVTRTFADDLDDLKTEFKERSKKYRKYIKPIKVRNKKIKILNKELEALRRQLQQSSQAKSAYNEKRRELLTLSREVRQLENEQKTYTEGYQRVIRDIWELDTLKAVKFIWSRLRRENLVYPEIISTENGVATLNNEEALSYLAGELTKGGVSKSAKMAVCKGLKSVTSNVVVDALVRLVEKEDWNIASAAAVALHNKRKKDAVPRLIEALKKAEDKDNQRLCTDILNALRHMTGRTDFTFATDFESWWNDKGKDADFSEIKETTKKAEPKGSKLTTYIYGDITSKRVIFILDISHSMTAVGTIPKKEVSTGVDGDEGPMTGEKSEQEKKKEEEDVNKGLSGVQPGFHGSRLDVCKKEFKYILDNIPPDTRFNVVYFNRTVTSIFKKLSEATDKNKKNAWQAIENLQPAGRTNTFGSLERALADKDVDTIYFLTDGAPTYGKITDTNKICEEIKKINHTRNVRIHCVALLIGKYPGEDERVKKLMGDFLKKLAKENGGTFKMISD